MSGGAERQGAHAGRSHACWSRRGFTLLEVMLAVAILGIIATTIYGTFSRTLRSKGIAEERIDVVRTGRSAVDRMAEELAAAFYPTPRVADAIFRCVKTGTEDVPLDAIWFSALSRRPVGTPDRDDDQRLISYFFPVSTDAMRRT